MLSPNGLVQLGRSLHLMRDHIHDLSNLTPKDVVEVYGLVAHLRSIPILQGTWELLDNERKRMDSMTETELDETDRIIALEALANAEGHLDEELTKVILIEPETSLQVERLLQPESLLGDGKQYLTEIEFNDFTGACSCVLARAYTASEFLALRAVESLLSRWYKNKTGKELDAPWGAVLEALEKEYPDKKTRPKELTFFDYLNERRIEVAHPKRISILTDAEFTVQAVVKLAHDLRPFLELASQ